MRIYAQPSAAATTSRLSAAALVLPALFCTAALVWLRVAYLTFQLFAS